MSTHRRLRTLVSILVALAVTGLAAPARADYKSSYTKGIRAVDKKDWQEVAQWMRQAISEQPDAAEKKMRLYGNRYAPYLPYYHLGLALYNLGDCEGAVRAWNTSEQQGAVQASGEYSQLTSLREDCNQRAPAPTAVPTALPTPSGPDPVELLKRARQQTADAIAAAEQVEQTALGRRGDDSYAAAWAADGRLAERFDEAANALARARSAAGSDDIGDLENGARLAAEARQSYESLVSAVDRTRQDLAAEASRQEQALAETRLRLVREIEALLPAARDALAVADSLSTGGQRGLAGEGQQLQGIVAEAEALGDGSRHSPKQLENLRSRLERSATGFRDQVDQALAEESRPVPPTPTRAPLPTATPAPEIPVPTPFTGDALQRLRAASEAFLGGEYSGALAVLSEIDGEGRVAALSHLVRAASAHSLFTAGGGEDSSLRNAAVEAVRRCRQSDAELAPDTDYFSPAFVGFFNAGR